MLVTSQRCSGRECTKCQLLTRSQILGISLLLRIFCPQQEALEGFCASECHPEVMVLSNFRLIDNNLCRWSSTLGGKSVSWPHVLFTSGLWCTSAETVHRKGEEQKKYK